MKTNSMLTGCGGCGMTRRGFLTSGCAACVGAVGLLAASRPARAAEKMRIRVVYSLHAETQPGPD
ncbi:MAG TPA: hypothetical protein PKL84_19555, partial [Candidatus Hydrogenedentes bacterium]|nr:hypothetical protein [Candidatus Hydrogenedentota bacterium]